MSKSKKKGGIMRALLRRPHKDDFHEQREHEQQSVGALRYLPSSTKIAVATDLSLTSCRAVDVAIDLAIHLSAELVVIHCIETTVPPYPIPLTPDVATLASAARKALDQEMRRVRETVPGARKKLLQGCAIERIPAFVEEDEIDLLVFGSADAPRSRLLSTFVERVTESVHVPVLVVRPNTASLRRLWLQ